MTKRTRARDAGFTLVEAMVALVVFSIGILGLAALMPIGSRTVSSAGRQTRASELCSNAAENLLALPYDAPDLTSGTHDDPGNPFPGIDPAVVARDLLPAMQSAKPRRLVCAVMRMPHHFMLA